MEVIMHTVVPETVGFSSARLSRINALMQAYVDRKELPGILTTLSCQGKTIHLAKYGAMDIEAGKPMEFDAIFRIASMTKAITSIAMMMLYEEGIFNLNTPVERFLPGFKDAKVVVKETPDGPELADLDRPLTMRHLFTHTAGLSYGWDENDPVDKLYRAAQKEAEASKQPMTLKTLVETLSHLPLAFQPGTHWRYSYAIDVLGYLVELISGLSLDQFFAQRIFAPLGMVDTAFYVPEEKASRLAAVYTHRPGQEGLQRMDIPLPTTLPSFLSGGGGLFSTLHDYGRFAQMLVNGGELDGARLLSPTTVALMEMNHAPAEALPYSFGKLDFNHIGYGYGLGMRVLMDVAQSGLPGSVGEFGWDGAFNTYFWIDRKEALYGLLMTQHSPNAYYPVAQQFKQLAYAAKG
jgi:CubicO group peptidase (beta-lactamase class C family)